MSTTKRGIASVIAIIMALTCIIFVQADVSSAKVKKPNYDKNAKTIYKVLRKDYSLSKNGAIAVVGAMSQTSGLNPNAKSSGGYGLLLWSHNRKKNVQAWQKSAPGLSKVVTQTDYFMYDIYKNYKKSAYKTLTYKSKKKPNGYAVSTCIKQIHDKYMRTNMKNTFCKNSLKKANALKKKYNLTY